MSKAFICGCAGLRLDDAEIAFFARERPWGLILFKRNCADAEQVAALCAAFRSAVGDATAPVLIDQEGGRVQRLGPPGWRAWPAGRVYGRIFERDAAAGRRAAWLGARLMAHDLRTLGITVDCLPVLDVPAPGGHDVIGDRAYGEDVETVSVLARSAAEGLLAGGVLPVAKHIPGHGRAGADSHLELPCVDADRDALNRQDFEPFRRLNDLPLAMTAHVVYTAIDPTAPATTSPKVISLIRDELGFDGCLMSDDVSMQALSGRIGARCEASLAAGCDLVLHCNGELDEMAEVAAAAPLLRGEPARRATAALARLQPPDGLDIGAATAELDALLAPEA